MKELRTTLIFITGISAMLLTYFFGKYGESMTDHVMYFGLIGILGVCIWKLSRWLINDEPDHNTSKSGGEKSHMEDVVDAIHRSWRGDTSIDSTPFVRNSPLTNNHLQSGVKKSRLAAIHLDIEGSMERVFVETTFDGKVKCRPIGSGSLKELKIYGYGDDEMLQEVVMVTAQDILTVPSVWMLDYRSERPQMIGNLVFDMGSDSWIRVPGMGLVYNPPESVYTAGI